MGYDNSKIEKLKIISKLYSEGVLTKEEMEAEKQKIMGNSTSASSAHQEDASEKVGTGESAEEDNEQANQAASNACETKSEQNDSEDSAVHIEKVEDKPKFHLPTWAYGVILMAVVLIIIGVIYIVKNSKEETVEETVEEVAMEEAYDDGLPKRIHADNSTTLDALFCDENVGDTLGFISYGDLTHCGDYEEGPIARAITKAKYIDCEMMGPGTGMGGVIKYGYKGMEDTYYCDGVNSAGWLNDPIIWVYNRKTKTLYAYAVPTFYYKEFFDLYKKYVGGLEKGNVPESFEAGGVRVKKLKVIEQAILFGDDYVGDFNFYVYTSDNVNFKRIKFLDGDDFYEPVFTVEGDGDWIVAIFTDYQCTTNFYISQPDYAKVLHDEFLNETPLSTYDYDNYKGTSYLIGKDKYNKIAVEFRQTRNVNEIRFGTPYYN